MGRTRTFETRQSHGGQRHGSHFGRVVVVLVCLLVVVTAQTSDAFNVGTGFPVTLAQESVTKDINVVGLFFH